MANELVVRVLLTKPMSISDFPVYKSVNLTKEHLGIMVRLDVPTWRVALAASKEFI